jgi:probable HAF family extracellular repeat protein
MVGLGQLPGGYDSVANGVSADGSTVVGTSGGEAFKWTAATGMVGLGTLPNPFGSPNIGSYVAGVSGDGSTVVGTGYAFSPDLVDESLEAFVWTPTTGMVGLGGLPGGPLQWDGSSYSWAHGVSADGSTVVGHSVNAQNHAEAFVWRAATGMVGLGTLPGDYLSIALGVSGDGSTVVGYSDVSPSHAFIWTAATGMVGLGSLHGWASVATGVSGDGSTVVGYVWAVQGDQGYQYEAFVWTAATGMVGLGYLPGFASSAANGVSRDGSRVVGYGFNVNTSSQEAFVWTAATGMVGLGYLPGALNPASYASGVSADGSTVVGWSTNAQGNREAFVLRVNLDPSALILALIDQVKGLNLKYGIQNGLDSKLDAALQALGDVNNHNNAAAVNALSAFINAVQAQGGKAIPAADADALIAAATVIIHLLQ